MTVLVVLVVLVDVMNFAKLEYVVDVLIRVKLDAQVAIVQQVQTHVVEIQAHVMEIQVQIQEMIRGMIQEAMKGKHGKLIVKIQIQVVIMLD